MSLPEGCKSVIDWEQAAFMPRAYEVARAAAFLWAGGSRLAPAFLRAYVGKSGIGPSEMSDGARAWGCFSDHHVWALEEAYLNRNMAARRYIPFRPFQPFSATWREMSDGLFAGAAPA